MAKKKKTIEQVEATQAKAAQFARDVLGDDDLAADLEAESPESYAGRKHINIINSQRRIMANGNGGKGTMTKDDLSDCLDQVQDILTDVYTPEASREDLAAAIGDALDVLEGGPGTDDDSDDDADDDSDQG